jgi:hypothetical protein
MGEENFDDALTPWSTLTDVSAARVRPLGHAVDARLAIPGSFEDLKPRMFAISNPAVEHLNLINCLDILSQAMWTLSSAARMMLDVTTPAVIRASAMRLVVAGEISRCSKTILRPQATWATIAIGPTQ